MKARAHGRTGALLRSWRELRGLSQLELALRVDSSAKHLSFIETGRAAPSEHLLEQLCQTLGVDARGRDLLHRSAGFGHAYSPPDLDADERAQLLRILERILRRMEPCPAMVIDRGTNIVACNATAIRALHWLAAGAPLYEAGVVNVSELALSGDGLRPFLTNWEEVGRRILDRLYREISIDDVGGAMTELYERYLAIDGVPSEWRKPPTEGSDPLIRFCFEKEGRKLAFDSLVLTVGTPVDSSYQGIRVRYWIPVDEETKRFLEECAETPSR